MKLLEAVTLPQSGLRLKNRLAMAPMPTFGALPDGGVSPAEIKHYNRRARGGVAAIVAFAGNWRCDHDGLLDSLARCAEAIQEGGAAAILQLSHVGGAAFLNDRDARRLLDAFRTAARRARQAGFEAVEIHGGHGELLQQFFSPRSNDGPWAWGGPSLAARLRYPVHVTRAVAEGFRGACWYRLDPEEAAPDGITLERTLRLAEALVDAGAEVLDVAAKRYEDVRGPRAAAIAGLLGERAAVMAVGGVESPQQADLAIADGCALVGLGRVLLSEPDWPRMAAKGEADGLRFRPDDFTKLEAADTPPTVIDYLRRRIRSPQ
jgi:2,4-dienoyl-CoA reductase-like NADH-dependent reductase (Old Yellow Enzyme family)